MSSSSVLLLGELIFMSNNEPLRALRIFVLQGYLLDSLKMNTLRKVVR